MLFSATLDGDVGHLVRRYMNDPVEVAIDAATDTVGTMHHLFLAVHHMDKDKVVQAIASGMGKTLVFCQTKRTCDRVERALQDLGVQAAAIHGDLAQVSREKALQRFADGELSVLVATDVAARGIDIDDIGVVIHYEPAPDGKDYLHRSGRTARAGRDGWAVTLAEYNQHTQVRILQRALRLDVAPADRGVLQQPEAAQPRRVLTTPTSTAECSVASQAGRRCSKSIGDLVGVGERDADVVEAVEEAVLGLRRPSGTTSVMPAAGTSTREPLHVDGDLGRRVGLDRRPDRLDRRLPARTTGTRPFLVQLLRKMSLKLGAITASKPPCWIAHTACSRDEPTPNAGPATRIDAPA